MENSLVKSHLEAILRSKLLLPIDQVRVSSFRVHCLEDKHSSISVYVYTGLTLAALWGIRKQHSKLSVVGSCIPICMKTVQCCYKQYVSFGYRNKFKNFIIILQDTYALSDELDRYIKNRYDALNQFCQTLLSTYLSRYIKNDFIIFMCEVGKIMRDTLISYQIFIKNIIMITQFENVYSDLILSHDFSSIFDEDDTVADMIHSIDNFHSVHKFVISSVLCSLGLTVTANFITGEILYDMLDNTVPDFSKTLKRNILMIRKKMFRINSLNPNKQAYKFFDVCKCSVYLDLMDDYIYEQQANYNFICNIVDYLIKYNLNVVHFQKAIDALLKKHCFNFGHMKNISELNSLQLKNANYLFPIENRFIGPNTVCFYTNLFHKLYKHRNVRTGLMEHFAIALEDESSSNN